MKISMKVTLDGMVRTLKELAHQAVEEAERERRRGRQAEEPAPFAEGGRDEPGGV